MNLETLSRLSEQEARELMERSRWPDGAACPWCGAVDVHKLGGKAAERGIWKCRDKDCRRQFSATSGTVFHGSHIPIRTWLIAVFLICTAKKGISAMQLQRQLGLKTYKAAWFMAHRIRHAMMQEPLKAMLMEGRVEADETYLGGKPRPKQYGRRDYKTMGKQRPTNKIPVMALVQRDGEARAFPVDVRIGHTTLADAVKQHVHPDADVLTDSAAHYKTVQRGPRKGRHYQVNHSIGEYAKGPGYWIHSNTVEGFFSLLKRGVHGQFHHISRTHLQKYLDEFCWRWTRRKATDAERTEMALKAGDGKRLTYKEPTSSRQV